MSKRLYQVLLPRKSGIGNSEETGRPAALGLASSSGPRVALATPEWGEPDGDSGTSWERRVCLAFPCVLDEYQVRTQPGHRERWLIAESPEGPLLGVASTPFCPRCGGDLVPAVPGSPALHRPVPGSH